MLRRKTRVISAHGRLRTQQKIRRMQRRGYTLVGQNRSTLGKTTLYFERKP